jgi:hypothetical protein
VTSALTVAPDLAVTLTPLGAIADSISDVNPPAGNGVDPANILYSAGRTPRNVYFPSALAVVV